MYVYLLLNELGASRQGLSRHGWYPVSDQPTSGLDGQEGATALAAAGLGSPSDIEGLLLNLSGTKLLVLIGELVWFASGKWHKASCAHTASNCTSTALQRLLTRSVPASPTDTYRKVSDKADVHLMPIVLVILLCRKAFGFTIIFTLAVELLPSRWPLPRKMRDTCMTSELAPSSHLHWFPGAGGEVSMLGGAQSLD